MRLAELAFSMAVAVAAALAVVAGGGCSGSSTNIANTHVGKDELYKTGNFDYDEFFEDVHGLQGSAKSIVGDETGARVPLGQTLGVGETSIDRMLEVLKDKAEEFAQSKNRVHFEIGGVDDQGKPLAGKPVEVTRSAAKGRSVPKEADDFASALEQMIKKEAQVWEKYGPLTDRSKVLAEKAETLRGSLEKEFPALEGNKREEIARELKAARLVTEQIGELSDKVVANAVRFIKQSAEVLVAAANAEIKAPEKGAKGVKPRKGAAPAAKTKEAPPKPKETPAKSPAAEKPPPAPPPSAQKPSAPSESRGDFNP